MFDLRDIFELIDDRFNDGTFPQQQLVCQREQAILHLAFERSNEADTKGLSEFFGQCR